MENPELSSVSILGATFIGYVINGVFYDPNGKIGINLNNYTSFRPDEKMKEYILNLKKK